MGYPSSPTLNDLKSCLLQAQMILNKHGDLGVDPKVFPGTLLFRAPLAYC